jgi:alanine dehydrogenase
MIIGIPKEIKNHEYRVGMSPSSVHELTSLGHKVIVETHAGMGIGFDDMMYAHAGADIALSAADVFQDADMIVKVKEPQLNECAMLKEGQILFTYLHLAPDPKQTQALMNSKVIAIAYETVTDNKGRLPLLAPMSEVAGRMSVQAGAQLLEKSKGGSGVLLGGVPGVEPGKVVIIGGGVVGTNAAKIAIGMGANVTILDKSRDRLAELDWQFGTHCRTIYASHTNIEKYVTDADLVIGAVLLMGAAAPQVVTHGMVRHMRPGSVMVDVAIDQGGCFATSRPTTHDDPYYSVEGILHYCVTNMPGAVARTSTMALNNVTLPHVIHLANKGYKKALYEDVHLQNGLNVYKGHITCQAVADALGYACLPSQDYLAA